jgi:hypothetical protein
MSQMIPLANSPNQTLSVALNINGTIVRLGLFITYSEMAQYYLMSIFDSSGKLLLSSIPMITGSWPAANLLAQYGYLGIGSAYLINLGQVPDDYPTSSELGTGFILLWDSQA